MSWWDDEPRPQDKPVPEVAKHRSRKDTRTWCKGKVGRAHVVDQLRQHYGMCRVSQFYRHPYGQQLGVVRWSCTHWWHCSACGKRLEKLPTEQCPNRPAVLPEPTQHPYARRGQG